MNCVTGKKSYRTFYAAHRENKRKIKLHGVKMDIYKCRFCNQFHLTGHNNVYRATPYKRYKKGIKENVERVPRRRTKLPSEVLGEEE